MNTYKNTMAQKAARRTSEQLYELDINRQQIATSIGENTAHLKTLEESNPDYIQQLNDSRSIVFMWVLIVVSFCACFIDGIITNSAMAIICDQAGLPLSLKFAVPIVLVIAEIGISYAQARKEIEGEGGSFLARNVQYLIMLIIASFSVLVCGFTINGYSPITDGTNYSLFVFTTIAVQGGLLIASLAMHIWLIRHAHDITESIGFFRFRKIYRNTKNKVAGLHAEQKNCDQAFHKKAHRFFQDLYVLRDAHPAAAAAILHTVPLELRQSLQKSIGTDMHSAVNPQNN